MARHFLVWSGEHRYPDKRSYRRPGRPGYKGDYNAIEDPQIVWWYLWSPGPDEEDSAFLQYTDKSGNEQLKYKSIFELSMIRENNDNVDQDSVNEMVANYIYDPTNGSKSMGNIFRMGGGVTQVPSNDSGAPLRAWYSPFGSNYYVYKPMADMAGN